MVYESSWKLRAISPIHSKLCGRPLATRSDYYDPYRNAIVALEGDELIRCDRFLVPFLFTRSGIKPLTTIDVSRRYFEFYDIMEASDAVVVLTFGFNGVDSHINGMFRQLLERQAASVRPKLFIVWYSEDLARFEERTLRQDLARKIRVDRLEPVEHVAVGPTRKTNAGSNWLCEVIRRLELVGESAKAKGRSQLRLKVRRTRPAWQPLSGRDSDARNSSVCDPVDSG